MRAARPQGPGAQSVVLLGRCRGRQSRSGQYTGARAGHLLVASTAGDRSADLLAQAGRARGLDVTQLEYPTLRGRTLDPAWSRPGTLAILRDPYRGGAREKSQLRRLLAVLPKPAVLDGATLRELPEYEDKWFQFRRFQGHVPTASSRPATASYEGPYPVVLKRRIGSAGRGTYLVRSKQALEALLRTGPSEEDFLLQEYLEIEAEYRVLVLGDRVLGSVSRRLRFHPYDGWTQLGVKVDARATPPPALLADARRAAARLQCDFAGVDLVVSGARHVVIECNLSPQFRSTQKRLERDLAGEVIEFMLAKPVD